MSKAKELLKDEVNIVDPKLYCFATQKHKKEFEELQAENERLKERAKEDLKEIERLRSLVSQVCEERNKALKGGGETSMET